MMRPWAPTRKLIAIVWAWVLIAALGDAAQAATMPRLEPAACPQSLVGHFQCGVLLVLERDDRPAGVVLRLPYAVRRSAVQPSPDALTFLNGGPGLSELRAAPTVAAALGPLPEDVVFLERRGLGLAVPSFACPPNTRISAGRWDIAAALRCRDRWRAAGYDLDSYDSAAAAGDLEHLRQLLGYRQWDLFGISYGTAYAFSVMRDFPASVRSALLDSVYPYGIDPFRDPVAKHFDKFGTVFDACQAQSGCAKAYPDLRGSLARAVTRAQSTPLATEFGRLDGETLLDRLSHALQETSLLANLPALVTAAARGDGVAFSRMDREFDPSTAPAAGFPDEADTVGIWPMIECRERYSRHHGGTVSPQAWPAWLALMLDVELGPGEARLCAAWGSAPAPASIDRPASRGIPTLAMVGAYDPQTTPDWAAQAVRMLPTGAVQVAVIPGSSHVVTLTSCGSDLARQFLADPHRALDRGCIGKVKPIVFTLPAEPTGR